MFSTYTYEPDSEPKVVVSSTPPVELNSVAFVNGGTVPVYDHTPSAPPHLGEPIVLLNGLPIVTNNRPPIPGPSFERSVLAEVVCVLGILIAFLGLNLFIRLGDEGHLTLVIIGHLALWGAGGLLMWRGRRHGVLLAGWMFVFLSALFPQWAAFYLYNQVTMDRTIQDIWVIQVDISDFIHAYNGLMITGVVLGGLTMFFVQALPKKPLTVQFGVKFFVWFGWCGCIAAQTSVVHTQDAMIAVFTMGGIVFLAASAAYIALAPSK